VTQKNSAIERFQQIIDQMNKGFAAQHASDRQRIEELSSQLHARTYDCDICIALHACCCCCSTVYTG
jgi:hypothetical protein